MLNLFDIATEQQNNEEKERASLVPTQKKADPFDRNYFRSGSLTNTSLINLCYAVAYRMMKDQDVAVVPIEVILAVGDELGVTLATLKKSARKRVREHIAALEIGNFATCKIEKVEGKGKKAVTTSFELQGYAPTQLFIDKAQDVVIDYPAF